MTNLFTVLLGLMMYIWTLLSDKITSLFRTFQRTESGNLGINGPHVLSHVVKGICIDQDVVLTLTFQAMIFHVIAMSWNRGRVHQTIAQVHTKKTQ